MVRKPLLYGLLALVVILNVAMGLTLVQAAPWKAPSAQGGAPTVVSYQGMVKVGDVPYDGTGYFKFAIVNAAGNTTYWSNDGTSTAGSEPSNAVPLPVSKGFFSVLLGDTTLSGMTRPLSASAFNGTDRYLRVWFSPNGSTFTRMPDVRIASVPYALQAEEAKTAASAGSVPWSGVTGAPDFRKKFANVVVVAKSNGDFTSIQAAIDSITNASASNPYLIWVAPGVYEEKVTMKPYVHLQGAGKGLTIIQADLSTGGTALALASNVSVRDITLRNTGIGASGMNISGVEGNNVAGVELSNVDILITGNSKSNYGLSFSGNSIVTLKYITATVAGATSTNDALYAGLGPQISIYGGSFIASDGTDAYGIYAYGTGTFVGTADTYALASGATLNVGFYNYNGARAFLQGGYFRASGGDYAWGIYNSTNGAFLEAEGASALGEQASGESSGFYNEHAQAVLRGGSFTGNGGENARGIHNLGGSDTRLEAHSVSALGQGASYTSQGWRSEIVGTENDIQGGTFKGIGGRTAIGIFILGNGNIQGVYARGEGGSSLSYGLEVAYGTTHAQHSRFQGTTNAVSVSNSGNLNLALSQVNGGIIRPGSGTSLKCYGVYDGNYNPYTCP